MDIDLSAFYSALDAAEDTDAECAQGLKKWYKTTVEHLHSRGCSGSTEIKVERLEADSHKGKSLFNFGTPLYIAVVRCQPIAVSHLLALGEDLNYLHPDHGDGPILHAAESGYDDCLEELLRSASARPEQLRTIDRKIILGQGLPQYTEGGLSVLHLAAINGRVSTVRVLLENQNIRQHLLQNPDSFGRNPLIATLDALALADRARITFIDRLSAVVRVLCQAEGGVCPDEILATKIPNKEAAVAEQVKRNRILRDRCLQAEEARYRVKKRRGLESISKYYTPLHPMIHCEVLDSSGTWSNTKEVLPGVFSVDLLPAEVCTKMWEEIHNYEQVAVANPAFGLPINVRHDGNLGNLQDIGFKSLFDAFQAVFSSWCSKYMSQVGDFEIYHAFLTRNYVGRESNATFKLHQDKSDLTFNICLHASSEVEGSTVGFYDPPGSDSADPDQRERRWTYSHALGRAVVHLGSQWHKTDPIMLGTRGSLILWARFVKDEVTK